ncbi:hypothetical protein MKZ24_01840 [Paenibacillus sp. FSL R7-0297]|uniref:hypothetical protein n=1 Tax=unclassified Paenibacillus TaxID=185978 RepID=UPI0004F5A893|nr:hypothetical protein [Paenibacillus sp. FSL R5-0912]AIQ39097.1 hypothetical protein R50912_02815 [Paenibacillus sp. FSL R5-0912]
MDKKHQQNAGLLFAASFLSLTAARMLDSNGSNLMDFTQGMLTGIGIVGMVVTIIAFGRYQKRSQ